MNCREKCGVCCIVPNLTSHIPEMPDGKPAFIPCIHLCKDYSCGIYDSPDRPEVCDAFQAEEEFCGNTREEAIKILSSLLE